MTRAEMLQSFIGKGCYIRTVTFHYAGVVDQVTDDGKFVHLKDASWIAESGRFSEAIKTETFSEHEAYGPLGVWVHVEAMVDLNEMSAKSFPLKEKK